VILMGAFLSKKLSSWFKWAVSSILIGSLMACSGIVRLQSVEKIQIGMTQQQVLEIIGDPTDKFTKETATGVTERWVYDGLAGGWHTIIFKGDIVEEIQLMK